MVSACFIASLIAIEVEENRGLSSLPTAAIASEISLVFLNLLEGR